VRIRTSHDESGFTLIELLVVIIIIGILAAIAIPVFLNQRQKGWDAAVTSDLRNAATAEETHLTENNVHTASTADLLAAGLKLSDGSNYSGGTAGLTITLPVDAESYCLAATSQSAKTFYYDSLNGGLTTNAC
jgi:type IV pilus assembly protein PilA